MKKLLLMSLAAVSLSAMALDVQGTATRKLQVQGTENETSPMIEKLEVEPAKSAATSMRLPINEPVYTPRGEVHAYYRDMITRYPSYPYDGLINVADAAGLIYFDQNNAKAYFKNIIAWGEFDGYAVGDVDYDAGKVTLPLPQTISLNFMDRPIDLVIVKYDYVTGSYVYDDSFDSVTFTYNPIQDTLMLELPGEQINPDDHPVHREYSLGLVFADNGEFTKYTDLYAYYHPYSGLYPQIPEGVNVETWTMLSEGYAYKVNVAKDDEAVYIQGMFDVAPEGVVKCILSEDGKTATINTPQAQGIMYDGFVSCRAASDDGYLIDSIEISVDFEKGIIKKLDDTTYIGWMAYFTEYFEEAMFEFEINRNYSFAGVPANPTELLYEETYDDYYGSPLYFELPAERRNGEPIETRSLYYSIYVDGEIFTFEPDSWNGYYLGLPGPTTQIPYIFSNGNDILRLSGAVREVDFYILGIETIGVQAVYIYEGKVTTSDIVTLNVETGEITTDNSGVDSIEASDVVATEYYDLSGRRVENPSNGFFVKKMRMSDGTVKSGKQALR